jgi:FkbM family methyltransferase
MDMRLYDLRNEHIVDLDLLPKRPFVVDAGAGYGEFAESFKTLMEKRGFDKGLVVGIEPNKRNCGVLRSKSGLHRVVLEQALVGKVDPSLTFWSYTGPQGKYHQWGNLYGDNRERMALDKSVKIESYHVAQVGIRDLWKTVSGLGWAVDRIDYLKIDVEGAEAGIFRNWSDSLTSVVSQVSVETHSREAIFIVEKCLRCRYPTFLVRGNEVYAGKRKL